ncbi:MAG: alpha/beta fold hydrolase [Promethearchaeota archaeon]|jgi:pimeloyl-ACP methyl ester carboxylesterase
MPKVKVDGVNLYYEIHGDGFPLLMIQGLSENVYWWDPPMIEVLSKQFKIVLFDNRGVGRSDSLEGEVTIETMAADAVGLLDALDIKQAHILGHSMGGMIAQDLVLKFPGRVKKLVLCSTSCGGSKAELPSRDTQRILTKLSTRDHTRDLIEEAMPHIFTKQFINEKPEFVVKKVDDILIIPTDQTTFKAQMTAWMRYNSCRKLKTVSVPTLIVHGRQDILVPPRNGELLAEKMPNAEIIWFDSQAHLIHTEETDKFVEVLLKYLK